MEEKVVDIERRGEKVAPKEWAESEFLKAVTTYNEVRAAWNELSWRAKVATIGGVSLALGSIGAWKFREGRIELPAVSPVEGKETTLEVSRTQAEAPKTSIVPSEEALETKESVSQEKKAVIIKNETGSAEMLIDQEILNLMENEIRNSGLSLLIRMVVIRNMTDEVFKFPSEYGELISTKGLKKPLAVIVGLGSPEGPTIFLSDEPSMTKGLVLHELGHVADPYKNRNIEFAIPEFEKDYFKNHYLKYFESISRGELEPYLSADEKQIVVGRTIGLGGDLWEMFLNKLPNPAENINGATHWYIPDEKLRELADKLPSWSIQKMAVEWRIKELERLKKEGSRPDFNGFESQTWGTFLIREYYKDPERFKNVWPDLYPMVKKTAEETFISCRTEMWAELWRVRVLDREEAVKTYPEGVAAQERVIEYLRENQVDI